MRYSYELTFIVRIDPSEEVINNMITQVKDWVEAETLGEVKNTNRWGRRKLAYEIDKQRDGYYVLMNADIDPANLPELERNLRLSPNVLRYLLVRPGG
jgi:small subunit ribosomal protein S6